MRPAATLSGLFLCLVAFGHLVRLLFRIELVVGAVRIPMWPSVLAIVVPVTLAVWLWRDQRRRA